MKNKAIFLSFLLAPSISLSMSLEDELFQATTDQRKEDVERLLNAGANPLFLHNGDSTPLMAIVYQQTPDAVEIQDMLMRYQLGEQVKMRNGHGRTLLHIASRNFNPRLVQLFIQAGADVNDCANNCHATPLIAASDIRWGRPEEDQYQIVRQLVEAGADLCIKDTQQRTALEIAEWNGIKRIIPLLKGKLASDNKDIQHAEEDSTKRKTKIMVDLRRSSRIQKKKIEKN